MLDYLLIFVGCGVGGLFRHVVATNTYAFLGRSFPYGTLVVNVTGSFFMGLIAIVMLRRFIAISPQLSALLLVGFLGGYTTFSSFSMDTINLFNTGATFKALVNIGLSIGLCLLATWAGILLGKQL